MRKKLRIFWFFVFVIILIASYLIYTDKEELNSNAIKESPICQHNILENLTQISGNLTITFLNVSQGDSILISNINQNMLIDCGPNGKGDEISAYLTKRGINSLNYLVITHTDADHIGGCEEVIKNFNPGIIFMDGQTRYTESYNAVLKLIDKEKLIIPDICFSTNLGNSNFQFIHGNVGSDNANQNSLVLIMKYGKTSFLFDADCDSTCEQSLLKQNIDIDFLKVPHHGSEYGTTNEFLEKTSPRISFISVGKNSYGHPAPACLDRLTKHNIQVYRTDINGNILLISDGENYWVTSEK